MIIMSEDRERKEEKTVDVIKRQKARAPAENRTRGPTMATLDFTTKPLARSTKGGRL